MFTICHSNMNAQIIAMLDLGTSALCVDQVKMDPCQLYGVVAVES
jgi:hypothetical protein